MVAWTSARGAGRRRPVRALVRDRRVVGRGGDDRDVRRIRGARPRQSARAGLAAFEDAPCFLEDHGLDGADQALSASSNSAQVPFRVHADLRVQVPERAPVRGVPRHDRAGPSEVRGLRRLAARARAASGRGPLQGLGLLLDRLRPRRRKSTKESGSSDSSSSSDSGGSSDGGDRAARRGGDSRQLLDAGSSSD